MFEHIACAALAMMLFYREWYHSKREDKMLDRLMSKNLFEYKQTVGEAVAPRVRVRPSTTDEAMAKREDVRAKIQER